MTSSRTHLTLDHTDAAPLTPADPRAIMARSTQVAAALLAHVDFANADVPTPCSEWSVGDVARHLVAVLHRATAGPSGRALDDLPVVADVPIDGLTVAFHASETELRAAWADDAALDQPVTVPWGTISGRDAMATYAAEVLLHTWDLAVSIGVEVNWPEPDTSVHLQMAQSAFPAEHRGGDVPFDQVREAGEEAPIIDRLAAWMGRDTARWSESG